MEVTAVSLENTVVFALASSGDSINTLYIPKLHLHKGLPFNFDIGAFFSAVPDSNINLWGAELHYAVLAGSTTMPAIAVRASYSQLNGVNQLEFSTTGVDVSISKGFAFLTPASLYELQVGSRSLNSTPVYDCPKEVSLRPLST